MTGKILLIAIVLLLLISALLFLTSCKSKRYKVSYPKKTAAGTSLFLYREKIFTEERTENYNISVKATDTENQLLMTVGKQDGSIKAYLIPVYPYESIISYVSNTNVSDWNNLEEYETLDGKQINVSILYNGVYVNISTDRMPSDGEQVLEYLKSHFTDYMTEQYLKK